jgi:hypothetical protein
MQHFDASTVVEVDIGGWVLEYAIDTGWSLAAVQLPGWVALVEIPSVFIQVDIGVSVAVGGTPDGALDFAVGDVGALVGIL